MQVVAACRASSPGHRGGGNANEWVLVAHLCDPLYEALRQNAFDQW